MSNTGKERQGAARVAKLADVAEIRMGYPFREKIEFETDGDIPIVQLRNFDADFNLSSAPLLKVKQLPSADRYKLQPGDVLYASKGERNFAYAVSPEIRDAVPASYFLVLSLRTAEVVPEYLAWYINQPVTRNRLRVLAKRGTYMQVVPKAIFQKLPIQIPPLATQRVIVELDQLKRKEKFLTDKLEATRSKLVSLLCLRAAEAI